MLGHKRAMKINESFGPAKIAIQSLAILAFVMASIFSHGAVVRILSAAILLTISFGLQPNLFRARSGSLVPMFVMLTLAWLGAIGMLLYWLLGGH
jgi:hypothetical protein